MRLPAIVIRRLQQYRMIRALGGTKVNAMRMLLTGRSGKFRPTPKKVAA